MNREYIFKDAFFWSGRCKDAEISEYVSGNVRSNKAVRDR